ncbi:MAG: transporter, partial [Clostridium sp.]|nr:transporter [Clostridium sp.]
MKTRIYLFFAMLLIVVMGLKAQLVTLDECQTMARENYPAIARFSIIEQSKNYT